ncbi:MAG: cation transporter [Phycisphaerales bacterium]|nr:cation transporter [Phycisphaerales bacterium]
MSAPGSAVSRTLRLALIGLLVNVALAGIKLAAGVFGHSGALIADGIESFADILGSVVIWGGLHISSRPADANHPYGHGKAEALAALVVAGMIIAAAVWIAVEAIQQITTPHQMPARFTLVVLLMVVAIKEVLFRMARRAAAESNSGAGAADAGHHRSDAITSAAAFVGISIAIFAGPGFEPADDWAALLASAVIFYNGVHLAINPVRELLDTGEPGIGSQSMAIALAVPGVQNVQKALVRKIGPGFWIDMHLRVDPLMTVFDAHALSHRVKDAIRAAMPRVRDVLIHIEPVAHPPSSLQAEPAAQAIQNPAPAQPAPPPASR